MVKNSKLPRGTRRQAARWTAAAAAALIALASQDAARAASEEEKRLTFAGLGLVGEYGRNGGNLGGVYLHAQLGAAALALPWGLIDLQGGYRFDDGAGQARLGVEGYFFLFGATVGVTQTIDGDPSTGISFGGIFLVPRRDMFRRPSPYYARPFWKRFWLSLRIGGTAYLYNRSAHPHEFNIALRLSYIHLFGDD